METVRDCGAEIVELELEAVKPLDLAVADQVRRRSLGQGEVVIAVRGAQRAGRRLASRQQLCACVVAHGLQQPVADRSDVVGLEQALVDQRGEPIEDADRGVEAGACHRLGAVEVKPARKHR